MKFKTSSNDIKHIICDYCNKIFKSITQSFLTSDLSQKVKFNFDASKSALKSIKSIKKAKVEHEMK